MSGRPFRNPTFPFGGRLVALAVVLFVAAISAGGQVLTSRVDGRVLDETGAVVPGVTVTLTNVATNLARETTTNSAGLYIFPQVSLGTYRVEATLAGFKTALVEEVQVALGTPANVDIVVEVGVVTQTVVVTASQTQSVVNEVNAEISTNLNREQVKDLPLNGRSVTQLALTQAGVTSPGGTRSASINGGRGTFNNFTLDGINNQDTFIRTDALFGIIPVQESFIEEVSITTANADVDAGLGSSQTQFVTRSGGNAYHGEVFYYHRNDALNATNYFNNAAGIDKERVFIHQFGFNVGGPILKDKLFFFVNYEEERSPGSASVVRNVLTDSARAGNFSYVRQDNGQIATVNLFELSGFSPDPAIASLVDLTPMPNDSSVGDGRNTSGYRFNSPDKSDSDWFVLRGDYEISSSHSFTGIFHRFSLEAPTRCSTASTPSSPAWPAPGRVPLASWVPFP